MKKYKIIAGNVSEIIKTEEYQHEQDALDIMIDMYEEKGYSGCFCTPNNPDSPIPEDEYVIGGNHGLALYHGGNFSITQIK